MIHIHVHTIQTKSDTHVPSELHCFPKPIFISSVNEFLNIDVTLLCMPLYFLQSSVDPDDFALRNKVFLLLHCTFKFFDSQGSVKVEHPLGYRFPGQS